MSSHSFTVASSTTFHFAGVDYSVSRPHRFGLVIDGPTAGGGDDYLHQHLLSIENRSTFFDLIANEGLIVCRNVHSSAASYRPVHGKSSRGKLSQAEYYHHDGCSCPTKPMIVEIRLPYQECDRNVATAIAPFPAVIRAMIATLPERLKTNLPETSVVDAGELPDVSQWDKLQGRITRLVRREMDAESCRAYFRDVDQTADAYALPWQQGESRLMLNDAQDLACTMQHRRAYQKSRDNDANEQNGSLVKRWTAEELA